MFDIPADTISSILAYTASFFNDVKVYFFLAVGVALGLFIVSAILKILVFRYSPEPETGLDDDDDELDNWEL